MVATTATMTREALAPASILEIDVEDRHGEVE